MYSWLDNRLCRGVIFQKTFDEQVSQTLISTCRVHQGFNLRKVGFLLESLDFITIDVLRGGAPSSVHHSPYLETRVLEHRVYRMPWSSPVL